MMRFKSDFELLSDDDIDAVISEHYTNKCSTKSTNAVRRLKLKRKSLEDNHTLRGEDNQFKTDTSKKYSTKCTSTFKFNVRNLNGKFECSIYLKNNLF